MVGYLKLINRSGKLAAVACDGRCDKAWGISSRPKEQLSADEDDVVYLADGELGEAPLNPGTYEGGAGKPLPDDPDKLNKWCVRECCRATCTVVGETIQLRDWSKRAYNQPWKHQEESRT